MMGDSPKVGDYVLATKWSDGDPKDPWAIGVVSYVGGKAEKGTLRYYMVPGVGVYNTGYRKCQVITPEQGKWILDLKDAIESDQYSIWWWLENIPNQSTNTQSVDGSIAPPSLHDLADELEGVLLDVRAGTGVDAVCTRTIRRVIDALRWRIAASD